jgi:hypothetical protein
MLGAAIELVLELDLGRAQILDELVDLGEGGDRVLRAMQDQHPALDVLRAGRSMVAKRAVDRDQGRKRSPGIGRLDADGTAEAIAQERDLGGIDHRVCASASRPACARARISARSLL